jgi:electron transfer flavoprotein alpha subunit
MSNDIYVLVEHLRGSVTDISFIMLAAAKDLTAGTGGQIVALLLGHDASDLSADLAANTVWYMDSPELAEFTPDAYQSAVADLIQRNAPRAVLLGHTSIGMDVASTLSARLDLPLVSQCRYMYADKDDLKFLCRICGGKMMAEGMLPGPTALATFVPGEYKPEQGRATHPPEVIDVPPPALVDLRVSLIEYLEPEAGDVDITKEPLLISVGRGIQREDNVEVAEELAATLGGAVSASRPVVDQRWLPTSRLVGKSGKTVKPKLYFALGISGAPEHVEAITDSEVVIAVNTDPSAPIFDIAKYGAVIDIHDLMPLLIEEAQKVREA